MKPSRQGKYRQVEEFLRILDASISDALDKGHLRTPDARGAAADRRPRLRQRLPDLRHRALPHPRARPARPPDRHRPARAVAQPQRADRPRARRRRDVRRLVDRRRRRPAYAPDVVLALHACDTATDDALARAVEWGTPLILAAPCCHHDIAAQLRRQPTPAPYAMLTRHGILRERFADTLTDGLRASLLRLEGYRVDVMQFVGSQHTPRNTLLRGVRTGRPVTGGSARREYDELVDDLGRPAAAGRAARAGVTSAGCSSPGRAGDRRPFALGVAVDAAAPRTGHRGLRLRRPGDRRGERAGRRRTACS